MNPPPLICKKENNDWPCELTRDWAVEVKQLKERVEVPYFFRSEKAIASKHRKGST